MKKILVIGGTGKTGRLIVDFLLKTENFNDAITIASRHPESFNTESLNNVSTTYLDISKPEECIKKVAEYDFVILAIGPFSKYGIKPFEICLQAGVSCLDINDDYNIHKQLVNLKPLAKEKNVSIYTGMGLNPGLTTLQILELIEKTSTHLQKDIDFSLFIGSKQLAGYTAIEVMLDGFGFKQVPCIINAELKEVDVNIDNEFESIDYENGLPPQYTFLCPSPQMYSFYKSGLIQKQNIRNLRFTIAFQSMNRKAINFFRKNSWILRKKMKKHMQNLIFMAQKMSYNKKENVKETYSLVKSFDDSGTYCSVYTGLSSYEMTALFAAIMTTHLMHVNKLSAGIYSFEDLASLDIKKIKKDLKSFGLTFNEKICKKEIISEYLEAEAK